jgi:hypothetical protein
VWRWILKTVCITGILIALIVVPFWLTHSDPAHEHVIAGDVTDNTSLQQEAYVWQRNWDVPVTQAIEQSRHTLAGYCVLAAEVSWSGSVPRVAKANIDFSALKRAGKPIGLALRIGPYAGAFCSDDATTAYLTTQAVTVLARARDTGLDVAELQLDFDCAESKLDGYLQWVSAIRKAVHPVPLTITVLPCWLKHKSSRTLARATDGYVLQVHSLDPPTSVNAPIVLCDSQMACRWAMQADAIGVPFRVALPTYGYLVAFDKRGKFIGLAAESQSRDWQTGTTLRQVHADAKDLAALVRKWTAEHPHNMTGILWYRLPVAGDSLNWPWKTMAAVMAGKEPVSDFSVTPQTMEAGLVHPPATVMVQWHQGQLLAADGYHGYGLAHDDANSASLALAGVRRMTPIKPGESMKLGWLRFNAQTEVTIDVE